MRIGIDFDNTIAGYDHVFDMAARAENLVGTEFRGSKAAVKAAVQAQTDGEQRWMRLQGKVYGTHMARAELIEGVGDFLRRCRSAGVAVRIVSHKTEFGHFDTDRVNLRDAARQWMESKGFFEDDGFGLQRDEVYFEPTRAEKVARIRALECTHFVDDLEDVFLEPEFPRHVRAYLLVGDSGPAPQGPYTAHQHWNEISDAIFGN